jgi:hypothetical protein
MLHNHLAPEKCTFRCRSWSVSKICLEHAQVLLIEGDRVRLALVCLLMCIITTAYINKIVGQFVAKGGAVRQPMVFAQSNKSVPIMPPCNWPWTDPQRDIRMRRPLVPATNQAARAPFPQQVAGGAVF